MIRTEVTWLLLKRVDVNCGFIEPASEFKWLIHLSFYRFKAVGVYSNVNILPFHLEDYYFL